MAASHRTNTGSSHATTQGTRARTSKTKQVPEDLDELGKVTFGRVLTEEQVDQADAAHVSWEEKRRVALFTLARTKEQLVNGFDSGDGPDLLLEMLEHLSEYKKYCEALAEMAAAAAFRLAVVAASTIEKRA